MKADAMNAFGGVRVAQDKNRDDESKSDSEPEHFKTSVPSATSMKVPPLQPSMTDMASTATGDPSRQPIDAYRRRDRARAHSAVMIGGSHAMSKNRRSPL